MVQLALWSWPFINIYNSFITDSLHQDSNGMIVHLIKFIRALVESRVGDTQEEKLMARVNQRLGSMSTLLGARIATLGFAAPQLNAEERKGMWKFLPAAANGLWHDDIVSFVADYAQWQQLRDSPIHTTSSVLVLKKYTAR